MRPLPQPFLLSMTCFVNVSKLPIMVLSPPLLNELSSHRLLGLLAFSLRGRTPCNDARHVACGVREESTALELLRPGYDQHAYDQMLTYKDCSNATLDLIVRRLCPGEALRLYLPADDRHTDASGKPAALQAWKRNSAFALRRRFVRAMKGLSRP